MSKPTNKRILALMVSFLFIFSAIPALAIEYVPLEPNAFPGIDTKTAPGNLGGFLGQIFNFGIAIAVVLALIMIIWGGIEMMTSDSWQKKDSGKEKIRSALFGLGIALLSWLLLYTINPNLVSFSGNSLLKPITTSNVNTQGAVSNTNTTVNNTAGGTIDKICTPIATYECRGCVNATDFGLVCKCSTSCLLSPILASKLKSAFQANAINGESARITEANPITVPHDDKCHSDGSGSCVDVNFDSKSTDVPDVKNLYEIFASMGLHAVYETQDCPKYEAVGVNCQLYRTSTPVPSFHVELQ
jgi:hypothetical protein